MKKRFVSVMLTLALTSFSLVGCSSGSSSSDDSKGEGGIKVGFSISTLNNPFFVSMADGAKAKAEELNIELVIADAGNDSAKQNSDIEDLVSSNIDVLIVNPNDAAAIAPIVQDVQDQGIKVIAVDRYVEGVDVDCFIGTDNVEAGKMAGDYLAEKLGEGAEIAILEGIPGASSAIDRYEGFLSGVEEKLSIVSSQTANYDRAEGLSVTENILQANPDIKGILAANDEMALGAIQAVEAAGKVPGKDILVTGFDAGADALDSVEEGKMLFTVEQKTVEMGEIAVETALKMSKDESIEKNIPIDVILIDK